MAILLTLAPCSIRYRTTAKPLPMACLAIVRYLVEHGADRDKADNEGLTPLAIAQRCRRAEIVAYLTAAGCI